MIVIPVYRCKGRGGPKEQRRARAVRVATALADDSRTDLLDHFWSLSNGGYARAWVDGREVFMHHLVAGFPPPGMQVSHENSNPLDNRLENLRICTQTINRLNDADGPYRNNKSGIRGVHRCNDGGRSRPWRGSVRVNGKIRRTHRCATAEEAAAALAELKARLRHRDDPPPESPPESPPTPGEDHEDRSQRGC